MKMIKKAVIFCGGKATRFNNGKPGPLKPLIKVNNEPILLKIIKIYSSKGVNDFILLGGYKYQELKNFFKKKKIKNIKITVLDTGYNTETAGRLLKAKKIIGNDRFFLTYGDSITDFDPIKAYKILKDKRKTFLISVYKKKIPYGIIKQSKNYLSLYSEKKIELEINAGFYIFDKDIFKYISSCNESLEKKIIPLILKNKKNKILTYECKFWHPMDDRFDRIKLSKILKK